MSCWLFAQDFQVENEFLTKDLWINMDLCVSNIYIFQSLFSLLLHRTTASISFIVTGTHKKMFKLEEQIDDEHMKTQLVIKIFKKKNYQKALIVWECCWLQHVTTKMLVWGHWRLGKNRLCVYPFFFFSVNAGLSPVLGTHCGCSKTSSLLWKQTNVSLSELHASYTSLCLMRGLHSSWHGDFRLLVSDHF